MSDSERLEAIRHSLDSIDLHANVVTFTAIIAAVIQTALIGAILWRIW